MSFQSESSSRRGRICCCIASLVSLLCRARSSPRVDDRVARPLHPAPVSVCPAGGYPRPQATPKYCINGPPRWTNSDHGSVSCVCKSKNIRLVLVEHLPILRQRLTAWGGGSDVQISLTRPSQSGELLRQISIWFISTRFVSTRNGPYLLVWMPFAPNCAQMLHQ